MEKVVDIKFLKVEWKQAEKKTYDETYNCNVLENRGLDIAHAELEAKIREYLKDGWVMKGDVAYRNYESGNNFGSRYLVQTMVKYESTRIQENLLEM